jgi:cellulose biosynthesis protein BcsQ
VSVEELPEVPKSYQPPLARHRYPDGPLVFLNANEGGGTGKTVTSVNLGVALSQMGLTVVVADHDQTMAASTYLGYGVTNRKANPNRVEEVYQRLAAMPTIYDVLHQRATFKEILVPARTRAVEAQSDEPGKWDSDDCFKIIPNLYLALGSRDMSQASEDIRNPKGTGDLNWLRRALQSLPQGSIDVVIGDCRGTFDTLELSLLGGADFVIGCMKPDSRDDDTLISLHHLIDQGRQYFEFSGGCAELRYILCNGFKTNRGNFYKEIYEELVTYYGPMVLPYVTDHVQVAESVRAQEPIAFWMPTLPPVAQYREIAKIVKRDLPRAA